MASGYLALVCHAALIVAIGLLMSSLTENQVVAAALTLGASLMLWFAALPHLPMADMTAIGFTGPIFIMLGAALVLKEPMRWSRWIAALIGFTGVLIVVGPKLAGA